MREWNKRYRREGLGGRERTEGEGGEEGGRTKPATDEQKITLPQPFSIIAGRHSCVSRYAEPQLERHDNSKSSTLISAIDSMPDLPSVVPALLKRIVGRPILSTTWLCSCLVAS